MLLVEILVSILSLKIGTLFKNKTWVGSGTAAAAAAAAYTELMNNLWGGNADR